jgi:hypothetical protein
MRTRTRDMVRLLATLRHAAQCTRLRAARAQEEIRLLRAEPNEEAESSDEDDRSPDTVLAKPHRR